MQPSNPALSFAVSAAYAQELYDTLRGIHRATTLFGLPSAAVLIEAIDAGLMQADKAAIAAGVAFLKGQP